jgi:hypothetical protein
VSEAMKGRVENGAEAMGMEVAHMDERSMDETLRMIARMPAPEGLEERVKAGLQLAETPGRVLAWPATRRAKTVSAPGMGATNMDAPSVWVRSGWARGAAAAAIALVVAGGGWGIYTRVAPEQSAKTGPLPAAQPSGTFSESGAMRRPLTLAGPKVAEPVAVKPLAQTKTKDGKPVIHSQVSSERPGAPSAIGAPAQ